MTSSSAPIENPEDVLQEQIQQWKEEQKVIENQVQVYGDLGSSTLLRQNHDGIRSAEIVEKPSWCKVLRSSFQNYGDAKVDSIEPRYLFGGVDIGWPNPSSSNFEEPLLAVAVYVVLDARTMKVVYRDHEWISMAEIPPYVSTFLAFREIAPIQNLVQHQKRTRPDMTPKAMLVDGNGIFHPRHSGIACFVGVRTNIPTIGIGKTLLYIGNEDSESQDDYQWTRSKLDKHIDDVLQKVHQHILLEDCNLALAERLRKCKGLIHTNQVVGTNELNTNQGAIEDSPLRQRDEILNDLFPYCNGISIPLESPKSSHEHSDDRFKILGAALVGYGGSKASLGSKKPIIVSVGHMLSLEEATTITASLSVYRIPEPIRQADLYGRELLRERKML